MVHAGVVIVGIIAACVAVASDAFFGAADTLTVEVAAVLKLGPPPDTGYGMALMHFCPAPSDLIRGKQIALLTLLLGGVPAALLAAGLEAGVRRPWSGAWTTPFFAGFIFQLNSLALTTFLFFLLAVPATVIAPVSTAAVMAGGFLVAISCNICGLRSWRALQFAARETPPRVTPA